VGDKYWEASNEFLRFFAKAYKNLYKKIWTKKQYNQHMADFYKSKGMMGDYQYHQEVADNEDALPNNIQDNGILP